MIHRKVIHHIIPHIHDDGTHHRAHAISSLALFGYLQLLFVFAIGLFVIKATFPAILGTVSYTAEQIITLTNQKRAEFGAPSVSANKLLSQAASAKAGDMFANNYWAHNSPQGKTPWNFISAAGYRYIYAGENLARDFNDPGSVVNAWMNSPSHRSNLLDKNFKEIGVAVLSGTLEGEEGILVVQMFGSGISQIPTTQPLAQTPSNEAQNQLSTTQATPQPTESTPIPVASPQPSPQEAIANLNQSQEPVNSPGSTGSEIQISGAPVQEAIVLASNRFSIAKGVSLALIGIIFLLFAVEATVSIKKSQMTPRSGIFAHLLMLAFVLFAVWYAVAGSII